MGANGTALTNTWENQDSVRYEAAQKRFTITAAEVNGVRTFTVTDSLSAEFGGFGTDTLTNIEQLDFSDGGKQLNVNFSAQGNWNQVNGTDFADTVDADALGVLAAGSALVIKVGEPATLDLQLPGVQVVTGQKFVAVLGQMVTTMPTGTTVSGGSQVFQPLTSWEMVQGANNVMESRQVPVQVSLVAQSNGHLTGSYSFSNVNGQNVSLRVYRVNDQGVAGTDSLYAP